MTRFDYPLTHFHKRIRRMAAFADSHGSRWLDLECGHRVVISGRLNCAEGAVLCETCRDLYLKNVYAPPTK